MARCENCNVKEANMWIGGKNLCDFCFLIYKFKHKKFTLQRKMRAKFNKEFKIIELDNIINTLNT